MASQTTNQTQQFLTFCLSAETLAMMPTEQLTEILNADAGLIVEIPNMPSAVMGVSNWRGEVLWLVDLSYYLGFSSLSIRYTAQTSYNIIVVQNGDRALGFVVERVRQMVWCDPSQIQLQRTSQANPKLEQFLKGYWLSSNQEIFLSLDGKALVSLFAL